MLAAECFELNAEPRVERRVLGASRLPVVIVDDFYRYPERVRALADSLSYTSLRELVQQFPGERAEIEADTRHLARAVWQYYGRSGDPVPESFPFCVSRYCGGVVFEPRQRLPHVDPTLTALIYLNRPDECAGGTALYRHRSSGLERIPLMPDNEILKLAHHMGYRAADILELGYPAVIERMLFNPRFAPEGNRTLNEGNPTWELLTLVEMRFNRLVIYDGRIPHGMWVEPDWYLETPRINQLLSVSLVDPAAAAA